MFRFKQFSLEHDASPMKVGTDGVLLGALAPVLGRVLDVGAGCGLVGIMAAQRGARRVTLLEIDAAGADEARLNAAASPWADRIEAVRGDFLAYRPEGEFDTILSNPPFFATGELAPDARRAGARHQCALTPEAFMTRAAQMLAAEGTVSVIVPADRLEAWSFAARLQGLHETRVWRVVTRPERPPRRVVATWTRRADVPLIETLSLDSPEYSALVNPFYL